ncbi:aspartic proteinase CDR1 [Eucalyptus grandis]|uniref:aspartic proteinase CDR1 n=1 Tax=Eucalyptus grandis TaxID=71139 RepID=UPI00192E7802|nr:aspartic proteinase CDR1 [Eucalyptus grandis]
MEASLKFHSLLSFTLILAFSILCESASDYGFTTELIHRDSPRSPYYNPADTPYRQVANAIRRSISRAHRLSLNSGGATLDTPSAVITSAKGEYVMKVSLGTPPVDFLGYADTGSDLIWTQCKPCTDCFEQASPLFDPSKSSTYKEVSCQTSQCEVIDQTSCGGGASLCEYSYSYNDQSYTQGNLATETITLGSTSGRPVSFPELVFGCGHNNNLTFNNQVDGIVGLGGGDASLVTQLGTATGGKFSYCLVPLFSNETSKLNFGANAGIEDALAKAVNLPKASDPSQVLSLCFQVGSDAQPSIPTVTFHFKGADVELNSGNTFVQVADGIICLSFRPAEMSIFGNLAQINYLIGYDIQNAKLSFKPVDCTSN